MSIGSIEIFQQQIQQVPSGDQQLAETYGTTVEVVEAARNAFYGDGVEILIAVYPNGCTLKEAFELFAEYFSFKQINGYFYERKYYAPEKKILADFLMIKSRMALYNERQGARVGDYLKIGDKYLRFVCDYGEKIQVGQNGSYYLGKGYLSHSGGCDESYPHANLRQTKETRNGSVWVFHADHHSAGYGRTAIQKFRVFELV